MKPTTILTDEHEVILSALQVLERAAGRLETGLPVADDWWSTVLAWLRVFADRNHHAKEEEHLFPAMARAGVPVDGGPIGVMLAEHAQGRALIQAMASGHAAGRAASARGYVDLLRAHIEKENGVLFPMADAVLDDRTQQGLVGAFDGVADTMGRDASIEHARSVVHDLAAALGEPAATTPAR